MSDEILTEAEITGSPDVTIEDLRGAARVMLENTPSHEFDDNPSDHVVCRGCGWNSLKHLPEPGQVYGHLPQADGSECELAVARRRLAAFAGIEDIY
jgi:hypothetical protein